MRSCLSAPVFLWQNSSFPFRVRRLRLVTATVCADRGKARSQDQKTRDEQSFQSVVPSCQSRSGAEAGGWRTRLGRLGPGTGSPQAVLLRGTQAGDGVAASFTSNRAMFNFPGLAPPANVILGAGLGAAPEGSPWGGRRVLGPALAEKKRKRSMARGEAPFSPAFLLLRT